MEKYINEIKLSGNSEFSVRFNKVSEAFERWQVEPEGEMKDKLWNEYFDMKFCLEQGLPI